MHSPREKYSLVTETRATPSFWEHQRVTAAPTVTTTTALRFTPLTATSFCVPRPQMTWRSGIQPLTTCLTFLSHRRIASVSVKRVHGGVQQMQKLEPSPVRSQSGHSFVVVVLSLEFARLETTAVLAWPTGRSSAVLIFASPVHCIFLPILPQHKVRCDQWARPLRVVW